MHSSGLQIINLEDPKLHCQILPTDYVPSTAKLLENTLSGNNVKKTPALQFDLNEICHDMS